MKKVLSLLSLAVLAMAFAAGCGGKHTKCEDAKDADNCKAEKFEENKFNCKWDDTANPKACVVVLWKAENDGTAACETAGSAPTAAGDCTGRTDAANKATQQAAANKASLGKGKCSFVAAVTGGTPAACKWEAAQ